MKSKSKENMLPQLRFPEFRNSQAWGCPTLANISTRITEKVGDLSLETVSITASKGFVTQAEKFGRDISGKQYQNYIVLNKGEFSYNKGNSKTFPQGAIYELTEFERVAAPNAFISFRFNDGNIGNFYKGYFENNFHGKQLTQYLTSGARSDGLLNISPDDFFKIELPSPTEKEQQKIADCLTSIAELIFFEQKKLKLLKDHKKGVMKKIFPEDEETEFTNDKTKNGHIWKFYKIGDLLIDSPDYGVNAPSVPFSKHFPTYLRITDITESGYFDPKNKTSVDIEPQENQFLKEGEIVLTRTGASVGKSYKYNKADGKLVFAGFLIRIRPNEKKVISNYLYSYLSSTRYWNWVSIASVRGGQPGINSKQYANFTIPIPVKEDGDICLVTQLEISKCFCSLEKAIKSTADKILCLEQHKKGLFQKLLPSIDEVMG